MDKKHDDIKKFERKEIKKFSLDLNLKTVGAVSTANVTGGTWGYQRKPGIIMNPNTKQHVRDLLNVQQAGPGTDLYFMYESGTGEGSIAAVAETTAAAAPTTQATGLKPQFDVDLAEAHVPFEIIAGWMLMSRKALNNIPGFLSFLQSRLPEKLMDVEDSYLLYGTGANNQVKGILTAPNYTASTSSSSVLVEKIIDDISLLEDTYKRTANGIAMRPADYYEFFKNKAGGSGEYDLPQGVVFVNGVLYILGIPVAKTTALTAGDYVVGDFQNGADLLVQESMRLEFFEQDSTNVRTNQITVRIEETIAFPVYGGNYFIKGDSGS
jgi:HK97 family phage major capsid protein